MAESVVNQASAAQLKSRNAEPAKHVDGQSYTDIGGRSWDGPAGPDSYKVDGAKGVSKDTSIPASVGAEPSHLTGKSVSEDDEPDEVEVEFDGEKKNEDVDDLDKALDEADLPDDEVKVDVKESDDDDEDDVKEDDDEEDTKSEEFNFDKKKDDDDEDVKESDDKDKDDVTEEDDEKKDDLKESLKLSIKMPKKALFESAGFSVKQQKRAAAIFESAVKQTTRQAAKQIHEHYSKLLAKHKANANRLLESRLNTYLDVVIEEWMTSNKVAVRQTLRSEMVENFMNGLQTLFTEHYIDVPTSKINVVEALTRENDALKTQLTEETSQKLKMRRLAEAANKKRIVAEFARNLSEAQAAKLEKLAEETDYVSAKDFREKLSMLKESYFARKADVSRLPDDDVTVISETSRKSSKTEIDMVEDAIARQAKSDW
tara:strand:- start:6240 stop:7526 length:1287 start_codon:yes stop_codon:yes gene_type:complete